MMTNGSLSIDHEEGHDINPPLPKKMKLMIQGKEDHDDDDDGDDDESPPSSSKKDEGHRHELDVATILLSIQAPKTTHQAAPAATTIPVVIKKYVCDEPGCGKSFSSSTGLKQHKLIHSGERPFLCEEEGCGKSFRQVGHLRSHIRTHADEKPYVCDHQNCGKSFARNSDLELHKKIHTGEPMAECSFCHRKFARESNLATHIRKHTGEKPYTCNFAGCGELFPRSDARNTHEKTCKYRPMATEPTTAIANPN